MIVVGAWLDFHDQASRDAAVVASAPVQLATREQEAGCHFYCFAADPCNPVRIQVYELWEDEKSLVDHFSHPNYMQMRETLRSFGLAGAWNRAYLAVAEEPVYGPDATIKTKFFADYSAG